MTGEETVIYKGIHSSTYVQKQIELQQWILDPSSRPYESREQQGRLVSRSASTEAKQQSIVDKQLALQRMIIE